MFLAADSSSICPMLSVFLFVVVVVIKLENLVKKVGKLGKKVGKLGEKSGKLVKKSGKTWSKNIC